MAFEPSPEELLLFSTIRTRLRDRFAASLQKRRSEIAADAAHRGIAGGYVNSQVNIAAGTGFETFARDLLWALIERFGAIYGPLTIDMIDWIDATLEEATALMATDDATRDAYLSARQERAIELGTLRAKIRRSAGVALDPQGDPDVDEHDAFICHAYEDKDLVARPLANRLGQSYRVWYDEYSLTLGDSLRETIERGLARSRYGVVVLSPHFFRKQWPKTELNALFARQNALGRKVILPVWVDLSQADVAREALLLADLMAAKWSDGLDQVVKEIAQILDIRH